MSENKTGLALFPNKNKKADNHPDFRGELFVTKDDLNAWLRACDGDTIKLRVACWKKTSKAGAGYLSGSVNIDNGPPQQQQQPQQRLNSQRRGNNNRNSFDDGI